jgi:hypothetical protein
VSRADLTKISARGVVALVCGLILLLWAGWLVASGSVVAGAFVATFVAIIWLPPAYRRARRRSAARTRVSGLASPFLGLFTTAATLAALALALGIVELIGIGIQRSVGRGVFAILGFFVFAHLAGRIAMASRKMRDQGPDRDDVPRR